MSLRKINNSDTEFQYYAPGINDVVEIEITLEGMVFDGYDKVTWQQIAKARKQLGLVSFSDEDFEKWQIERFNK